MNANLNGETIYQDAIKILDYYRKNTDEFFSVSSIQRRFRMGYVEATKIMERLESEGYVGEFTNGQPRKILK